MTEKPIVKNRKPMRDEAWFFVGLCVFFIVMTLIYGFWSEFEPVGTTALALLVGLTGMPAFYFMKLSGEVDERPEDVEIGRASGREGGGRWGGGVDMQGED